MNKCLKKAVDRQLNDNPKAEICAVLLRERSTGNMKLQTDRKALVESEEYLTELSKDHIVMEFYTIRKVKDKEFPVASRSCPWYGCMTCEPNDCDEECPPGTCN